MIAAIVVPAGIRSNARMRACLVSGRIAVFEDEGASRVRDLDLLVDREMDRAAAFFDLGLVMGSSEVRVTPSAAPPQPRRANHPAGQNPEARLSRSKSPQQRSDQGRKPVISEQIVTGRPKILPSVPWVRIPLSPPDVFEIVIIFCIFSSHPSHNPSIAEWSCGEGASNEKAAQP
jgi:hypothetical protein